MTLRAERYAEVKRLRDSGLLLREIADRLNISVSYTHALLTDPDGSVDRERKDRHKGSCVDCGAPTAYKTGGGTAERCRSCAPAAAVIWTEESVVAAIQRFASRYGRQPSAVDFNPPLALHTGYPEKAEAFRRDGDYPGVSSVQGVFGTWNAAMAAAGFDPLPLGHKHSDYSPEEREAALALYRSGLSLAAVQAETGISQQALHSWTRKAGINRSLAEARRLRAERSRGLAA